jgi:hypothetical protein
LRTDEPKISVRSRPVSRSISRRTATRSLGVVVALSRLDFPEPETLSLGDTLSDLSALLGSDGQQVLKPIHGD